MGQYYQPVLRKQTKGKHVKTRFAYAWDYGIGLKLGEHSYVENDMVNDVCWALVENPQRVIWFGDYTEKGDSLKLTEGQITYLWNILWGDEKESKQFSKIPQYNEKNPFNWDQEWYLINQTKKEYINMRDYQEKAPHCWEKDGEVTEQEKWIYHPLPLLTCSSNGKGGGDYWGNGRYNDDKVGSWCNDVIYISHNKPEGYKSATYYFQS